MAHYDIIIGGGGFAGSSLAITLARQGLKVLVVEPQVVFEDRVRGEGMAPWGVAEAAELGIDQILLTNGAREVFGQREMRNGGIATTRQLEELTPHQRGYLCFPHVRMQECLIEAAAAAGAQVIRGALVTGVTRGQPVSVLVSGAGADQAHTANLLVAADGRASRVAAMAGFQHQLGVSRMLTSGVMLKDFWGPQNAMQHVLFPERGIGSITFPIGEDGLTRAYIAVRRTPQSKPLRGPDALPAFISLCIEAGMSPASFSTATAAGPLQTYDGTHAWVDEPYRDGVALVGDAASTGDPAWGNGLALAARDVRELRDAILAEKDFDRAGRRYARAHSDYYGAVRRLEGWFIDLFYEIGEEADERRARALPCHRADNTRIPEMAGLGPAAPNDELAGLRFLGGV